MPKDAPKDTPDISVAVSALHPRLTRYSLIALGVMTVTFGLVLWLVTLSLAMLEDGEDSFKAVAILIAFGIATLFITFKQMRRAQEALVMPVVAHAVGLAYQKDAKGFLKSLPPALLPVKAVRNAEDYVLGRLGNHEIRMAEVKVETGGKNSRTLFQGLAVEFRNQIRMPGFLLAPHEQTKPGVLFGAWIPTDGLIHRRDVQGPSGTYGLWTGPLDGVEPPALRPLVEAILGLQDRISAPVTLFTATSNGTETCLALSHTRNLFRIGGFFPKPAQILTDVQTAAADLSIALTIAKELIALEGQFAAAQG